MRRNSTIQSSAAAGVVTPVDAPALLARGIRKSFPVSRTMTGNITASVHAIDGVDLSILPGQTLGLVGESGSGKSTVGRVVARLLSSDAGVIMLSGRTAGQSRADDKWFRTQVQIVLQDPFSSLDPTKTVGHAVIEPLLVQKRGTSADRTRRAAAMLERVGLGAAYASRYPAELSGGQRQRVAIARALVLEPKILVADEPTSALDLSTRSEILNLLLELQQTMGVACLLISHDFATIGHLSHRIAVMYLGRVVEEGPSEVISSAPKHPYAQAMVSAVPVADPAAQVNKSRIALIGEIPSPITPPPGCHFHTRCPFATEYCREVKPELLEVSAGHRVACHLMHHQVEMSARPKVAMNPEF